MNNNLYTLIYNNNEFDIDPVVFAEKSSLFAENYDPNQRLSITGNASIETFNAFLQVINGDFRFLTQENVDEVETILNDWGCESSLQYIQQFRNSQLRITPDSLIQDAVNRIQNGQSVEDIFPHLLQNITSIITNPRALELPYALYYDIFSNQYCPTCRNHDIFNLACGYFHKGIDATCLFVFVDFTELSDYALNQFFSDKTIDKTKIGQPLLNLSIVLFNRIRKEKELIEDLENDVKRLSKEAKSRKFGTYHPMSAPMRNPNEYHPLPVASPPSNQAPPLESNSWKSKKESKNRHKSKNKKDFVYHPESDSTLPNPSNSSNSSTSPNSTNKSRPKFAPYIPSNQPQTDFNGSNQTNKQESSQEYSPKSNYSRKERTKKTHSDFIFIPPDDIASEQKS